MEHIGKALREYKYPIIMAVLQWFVTTVFQLDRLIFTYDQETGKTLAVKFLYLLVLLVSWCYGAHVVKELKAKNSIYQRGFRIFSIYLSLMMFLLLFLWPGVWSWDDVGILMGILEYTSYVHWQHFLSGLYQAVLLQIIPHPGGIILIQNVLISLCVAFCIVKLETTFKIKVVKTGWLDTLIKLLPFLTFPVLMYQFSGYRMGLYVYLELTMLVMVICGAREDKHWTWQYAALLTFLVIIVSRWRTESLFYVIFIPLAIFAGCKKVLPRRRMIAYIVVIFVGFILIGKIQNSYMSQGGDGDNYKLISFMGPYAAVINAADEGDDKEALDAINKVVDVDQIRQNPDMSGTKLYWSHMYRDGYTSDEFSASVKALVQLSLKYPGPVFMERWNLFNEASGITGASWMINDKSITLFEQDDSSSYDDWFQEKRYFPVFTRLRARMINLLSCYTHTGERIDVLRRVIWNAWIPMIILIVSWFVLLFKRRWYELLICTAVVIRIPVVFLTEPSGWIMYLLSFYFLGYVLLVMGVLGHRKLEEK